MVDWRELREPWERLRWARMRAGFERSKDAAESLGMKPITYRTYERAPGTAGARGFDHENAARFGRKFKVSWTWLLTGQGAPDAAPETELRVEVGKIADRIESIEDEGQRKTAVDLIWGVLDAYAKRA